MKSSRPTAQFPKSSSVGERDWGKEILLVHSEGNFTMKKLLIKKGFSGGLQYHRKKDEAAYIISGILLVTYENEAGELVKKELREGNWLHFPKGSIHQETAISDVEIIEVSTPHFNDRVRVEEEFGLNPNDFQGLPTTKENEIITK
tara:strand:+ start:1345 stop:1782 length:438 start_codon:yes stop_codon:yes gene_type:complete